MNDHDQQHDDAGTDEPAITRDMVRVRAQQNELAAQAVGARVQALVQAKFVMASKNPRSLDVARAGMRKRCLDPQFAAKARYCVERGNKKNPVTGEWETNYIEGPSIRFVEELTQFYGNLDLSTTTLFDDEDKRIIRVEALDLETNTSWAKEITVTKTVERRKAKGPILGRRVNSYGDPVFILRATDEDFATKEGAAISKAIRTQALRLLPGGLVAEMEKLVMETQAKEDAKNPDAARLAVLDGYANIGITPEMLAELLGHPTDAMSPEEIRRLRAFGVALAEGSITWRELIDMGKSGGKDDPEAAAAKAAKEAEIKKKVQASVEKAKARAGGKKDAAPATGDAPADTPAAGEAKAAAPPPTDSTPKHDPTTHDGAEPPAGWEPSK